MYLNKSIRDKCASFADLRLNSSKLYKQRGETNKDKIWKDIYNGAIGEWIAYEYLKEKGYEVSEPDMQLYSVNNKSHSADLTAMKNGLPHFFHVKTQDETSFKRYGVSWLVQKNNKELISPSPLDFIIGIVINPNEAYVAAVVSLKDIVDNNLLKECRVPAYRHSKWAIYVNDVIALNLKTEL